jgi:glutamate/tyrosine decarboxylase-like PLP-dependent enzyme
MLRAAIEALQQQSSALEPNSASREDYFQLLKNYTESFLSTMEQQPSFVGGSHVSDSFAIDETSVISLKDALHRLDEEIVNKGVRTSGPGYLGYIPGGGLYASAMGDYLAALTNVYAGVRYTSPGASLLEDELIQWLKKIFNFPEEGVGTLTSGGSIATLIALTSARDKHRIIEKDPRKCVVYMGENTHHASQKALCVIGLEKVRISYVALDEENRMVPSDLEVKIVKDIAEGYEPFLLIASAGTTNTGTIDPLESLAQIAEKFNLWYHVDAAYGGFFVLVEEVASQFKGIELADSLVIDPHKGLFLAYGSGAVLIKDKAAALHSHRYAVNYLQDLDDFGLDASDISPELSRNFRGLRMWLPLRLHGVNAFKACLNEKLLLARYCHEELVNHGFGCSPQPDLSIIYFWVPGQTLEEENDLTKQLLKHIHQDGTTFLSSTYVKKRFVIRVAVLSFRTKLETIDLTIEMLLRAKKKLVYGE